MSRYIDFNLIGELIDSHGNVHYEDLQNLPTADVRENVRGEWITHKNAEIAHDLFITNYECSICHTWSRYNSNYCPDCGADMRGKQDA